MKEFPLFWYKNDFDDAGDDAMWNEISLKSRIKSLYAQLHFTRIIYGNFSINEKQFVFIYFQNHGWKQTG